MDARVLMEAAVVEESGGKGAGPDRFSEAHERLCAGLAAAGQAGDEGLCP
ncbi:MAG TPA: hypothetical protein QGF58_24345 [Myxococcota bacterium]|jgi:hypothetical protein|nr:hypothetical protein [Myxococcota bacterium]